MDTIEFRFTGGIADDHELNFYEAGRFHYAAARTVYTLEKFRQTGSVPARLTSKVKTDIRIQSVEHKCFLLSVYQHAAPVLIDCFLKVPLTAVLTYGMGLLFPAKAPIEKSSALAGEFLAALSESNQQETKRLEIVQKMMRDNNKTIRDQNKTVRQALDLLKDIKRVPNFQQFVSERDIDSTTSELKSAQERESILKPYSSELEQVPAKSEDKIIQHLHRTLPEIALPLRSSADALQLYVGDNADQSEISFLDRESIEGIAKFQKDKLPQTIRGTIKMYDKETGYGKFRYEEFERPLTFRVPVDRKSEYKNAILDSMKKEDVLASFFFVRDSRGNPVSLIFNAIDEGE